MNRWDFFYRQKVLEDELDNAFNASEQSDLALATDLDFAAREPAATKADYGGLVRGLEVINLGSGLQVSVGPGAAYDEWGRRASVSDTQTLTLTKDGETAVGAGGVPDGSLIDPGTGNERWLTLFLVYDRSLSEQRYDGYNNAVWFNRAESFHFEVSAGPVQGIGGLNYSTHLPARQDGMVLLEDIRVVNAAGTPDITEISSDPANRRTEFFYDVTAANTPNKRVMWKYNMRDVATAMLELYNDHVGGHADKHPAEALTWDADGRVWADVQPGATNVATNVRDALWGLIDDLSAKQAAGVGRAGTHNIGTMGSTGAAAGHIASSAPFDLPDAEILQAVLTAIRDQLNGRVFRGGDHEVGYLWPVATGEQLGDPGGNRWDSFFRDLHINRYVNSSLIPDVANDGVQDLGTAAARFRNLYLSNLLQNDGGTTLNGNVTVNANETVNGDLTSILQAGGAGLSLDFHASTVDQELIVRAYNKAATKTKGLVMGLRRDGMPVLSGAFYMEDWGYISDTGTDTMADHVPLQRWKEYGASAMTYRVGRYGSHNGMEMRGLEIQMPGGVAVDTPHGFTGPRGWKVDGNEYIMVYVLITLTIAGMPVNMNASIGLASPFAYRTNGIDIVMTSSGIYGRIWPSNAANYKQGAVNLIGGPPVLNTTYLLKMMPLTTTSAFFEGPSGSETLAPLNSDVITPGSEGELRGEIVSTVGSSVSTDVAFGRILINGQHLVGI